MSKSKNFGFDDMDGIYQVKSAFDNYFRKCF